ncbi:alpha/beta fold hydrolase [Brevibacillus sp. GCM10020057]|uniref:alpha/beta fold hydrolase n=1 Tax=Brevibacillus sp. GCM10020057 TaxID=3317327 RepID=UPI00363EFD45
MSTTVEMKNYFQMRREHARWHYEQLREIVHCLEKGINVAGSESSCSREFMAMLHALNEALEMANEWGYQTNHIAYRKLIMNNRKQKPQLEYIYHMMEISKKRNLLCLEDMVIRDFSFSRNNYSRRPLLQTCEEVYQHCNEMLDQMIVFIEEHCDDSVSWRNLDVGRSQLLCKTCETPVTGYIRHLGMLKETKIRAKEDYVPRRTYLYSFEAIQANLLPISDMTDNEMIVHPDDLKNIQRKGGSVGLIRSQEMLNGSWWADWQASTCPALLMQGEKSRILSWEHAQEMAKRRPNTSLMQFPGCGHTIRNGDPDGYNRAVRDFLKTLSL